MARGLKQPNLEFGEDADGKCQGVEDVGSNQRQWRSDQTDHYPHKLQQPEHWQGNVVEKGQTDLRPRKRHCFRQSDCKSILTHAVHLMPLPSLPVKLPECRPLTALVDANSVTIYIEPCQGKKESRECGRRMGT